MGTVCAAAAVAAAEEYFLVVFRLLPHDSGAGHEVGHGDLDRGLGYGRERVGRLDHSGSERSESSTISSLNGIKTRILFALPDPSVATPLHAPLCLASP